MAAITHVIFDFDGVLIDSEQVYSEVNQKMMSKYGKDFTLEMKLAMMGTKKQEAVRTLLRMAGLEGRVTPAEYTEAYDVELDRALCECPELPAASKLIDHFHAHGIPLAICTGSDAKEFEIKTDKCYRHWLEKIPLQVLCGSDPEVTHGKPSPIPYQVTMKRMERPPASPANALVFEDSLNGARSAVAAGTRCVMIPQPQFLDEAGKKQVEELRPQLAEVLNSLEEFDPTKYGLPPF
ncbi:Pseudouridine-5'-monophosphatase [Aphelenchoides fujianensis]|nr:Pseudouridine-5'-monophosphatase [Aphelenchoides fujianensis]